MKSSKQWSILALALTSVVLVLLVLCTAVIDPFFHYHGPLAALQYPIKDQRHQTDGILRNFEYDAIITGSSMSENYKASEFDALFGTQSVKVALSGSYLRETAQRLDRALQTHPNTRYVLRSLDIWALYVDKDHLSDYDYPDHLYDDNLFNDVYYTLNKSVLLDYTLEALQYTKDGNLTTTFDDYSNWSDRFQYGAEEVKKRYTRQTRGEGERAVPQDALQQAVENIRQNAVDLAARYPDTEFYYFIPPWSIFTFDGWNQGGSLHYHMALLEAAVKELLACENVRVFSFLDAYDVVCNAENYKDVEHYGEWINTDILHSMKAGEHLLTQENYQQHFQEIEAFYRTYDYDALFQ